MRGTSPRMTISGAAINEERLARHSLDHLVGAGELSVAGHGDAE